MEKETAWLLKEKYQGRPNEEFNKDVTRLKAGEPLDYVIGFTEFLGCKIDLSLRPLIPRPETEYWVEKAILQIYPHFQSFENEGIKVLDMFSGSGCIGVAIAKHIKNAHVVFAEKSSVLVRQIKINAQLNGIDKKRYKVIESDIFSKVAGKYDCMFANPPYIPTVRISKVQKSVLVHEPKMALFGGSDGLLYIRKFLRQAKKFLTPGGKIYLEFDSQQKEELASLLTVLEYKSWEFHKDQYGKVRYVVVDK